MQRGSSKGSSRSAPLGSSSPSGLPPPVWIAGIAAVLIVGGLVLRHVWQEPVSVAPVSPSQVPPNFKAAHAPAGHSASIGDDFGSDDDSGSQPLPSGARAKHGTPGAAERIAAGRGAPQPKEAPGREKLAAAPGPGGPGPLPGMEDLAAPTAGLGASLSVGFNGSANTDGQAPPIIAKGLEFDPSLGTAHFLPDAHLAYPDRGGIDPSQGSIAMWVRMDWDPSQPTEGRFLAELNSGTWENRLQMSMSAKYVGLMLANSDGVEQSVGFPLRWEQGSWHHVAGMWGEQVLQLYIDGALQDEREYAGSIDIPAGAPLYIGSRQNPLDNQPPVSMRGLNVFQRVLSVDEVNALMVQTAPPP